MEGGLDALGLLGHYQGAAGRAQQLQAGDSAGAPGQQDPSALSVEELVDEILFLVHRRAGAGLLGGVVELVGAGR